MKNNNLHRWFFALLFLLVSYGLLLIVKPFFIPILWATILATVLHPVYNKLNSFLGKRKNVSSFIMTATTTLLIVVPFIFLLTLLAIEAYDLYSSLQHPETIKILKEQIDKLTRHIYLNYILPADIIEEAKNRFDIKELNIITLVSKTLMGTSKTILSLTQNIAKNITIYIINFFIMIFALFFLFRDGRKFYAYILETLPLETSEKKEIVGTFRRITTVTILGNLATAAVQGILITLIFIILQIGYPILTGFITFIMALIPFVGATLIWLPVSIFLVLKGAVTKGIILLVFGAAVVSTSDNLLKPLIIGSRANLHTLFLFLTIIGGINYFGFSGLIIGPLLLAFFISFLEIYRNKYQKYAHKHK